MESYSLHTLAEFLNRVVSLNIPDAIWVKAEVFELNESKGHYYFNLIEKEEGSDNIIAKMDAVLWGGTFRSLNRKHKGFSEYLQAGLQLLLKVRVDFHERYGLKLVIDDIDPAYTVGELALKRQKILEQIHAEGLPKPNKSLSVPVAIKRVAILSNQNAAGFSDFMTHLEDNEMGYRYELFLLPVALQGQHVKTDVLYQLEIIKEHPTKFDVVCLLRGGGARLDLGAFDDIDICRAIAQCPYPVWTGIGHERDESFVDLVAHLALKTPTALANHIIDHNRNFEEQVLFLYQQIENNSKQSIQSNQLQLQVLEESIYQYNRFLVDAHKTEINQLERQLPYLLKVNFKTAVSTIEKMEAQFELLNIDATLKRGYAIIEKEGVAQKLISSIDEGQSFNIIMSDGKLEIESVKFKFKK